MSTPLHIKEFKAVDYDPFRYSEIQFVVPATPPQLEIFAACLMGGEDASRSYNESISLRLAGVFDQQSMTRSIYDLVQRHESLRASFSADGSQVIINKTIDLTLKYRDLVKLSYERQEDFISEFKIGDAETTFDLFKGPLIRVALFKLKENEHYLTLTAHHIICDGWSLGIMLQDLSKFYTGYAQGTTPDLHAAPAFSQYAIESLEFSDTEEYRQMESYWLKLYEGTIPVTDLPTDFARPQARSYKSERLDFEIPNELVSGIKTLAIKNGSSFVTTLVSLFQFYLHGATKQRDIVVGLPAAGQSISGNHGLVAHDVNLLPLRSSIESGQQFIQFVQQQRKLILDAFDHQKISFGRLVQKMPMIRDSSRIPLVPVVFNLDLGMDDGVKFHLLQHELYSNPRAFENFEIFVNANGSDKKMILEWSFNTQLFRSATISKMMHDFQGMIEKVIANPSICLNEVDVASKKTRGVKLFNTYSKYPENKTVHQLITEASKLYSSNIAIFFEQTRITYRQLNEKSNQLAYALKEVGVKRGDIVAITLERSEKMLITLLAIMKTGAAYLPIDPEYPEERIRFMLEDSNPVVILSSRQLTVEYLKHSRQILVDELWPTLHRYSKNECKVEVNASDIVYILYTSGSTGRPKGVRIAHQSLVNFLFSFRKTLSVRENDKFLGLTTLSFDISALELYLPLAAGASVDILPVRIARDGYLLLRKIKDANPTIVQATPATWQMLLEADSKNELFIRTICSGGEALSKDLAGKLMVRSTNLFNLYGPTETTIWSTAKKIAAVDKAITIGKPIDNTQVYILDEHLLPVTENEIGEIFISGDGLAEGYHKRLELTNEKFISDPFQPKPGGKMYRTGDAGRLLPNGEIECLGRIDQQIKIRGYRIEPGEIEYCLAKQKNIKAAVVILREDQPGDQRLVAYVIQNDVRAAIRETFGGLNRTPANAEMYDRETINLQVQNWKQSLKSYLPLYMIPSDIIIVNDFPLTPNGKIDRKNLPTPQALAVTPVEQTLNVSPVERKVTEIWKSILKIEKIARDDNFFEIGGHSLLAMRMLSNIQKEFNLEISLSDIFNSSLKVLAEKIDQLQLANTNAITSNKLKRAHLKPVKSSADDQPATGSAVNWSFNAKPKFLVPIRNDGNKIPFLGIISLNSYQLLSKFLPEDQPLFYLPPNMAGSVESIAANYIKELKRVRPFGPYIIGGFCEAGTVATEIAHQLESQGDEVTALILFEYYSANAAIPKASLKYISRRISYYKDRLISVRKASGPMDFVTHIFKNSYRKSKTSLFETPAPKLHQSPEYREYVFKPYDGKVILFKAGTPPLDVNNNPLMGWSQYFTGDVEVITVPGGHLGIFREPAIEVLAEKLNLVLEEASQELQSKTIIESFPRNRFAAIATTK